MGLLNEGDYQSLYNPAVKAIIRYNAFATAINGFDKWIKAPPLTAQTVASRLASKAFNLAAKGLAYSRDKTLMVKTP